MRWQVVLVFMALVIPARATAATMTTSLPNPGFGAGHVGEQAEVTRTLTIANTDTSGPPLTFTVTSDLADFTASPASGQVAPGGTFEVTLSFTPAVRGTREATLTVATPDDAMNPSDTYGLVGLGTAPNMVATWSGAPGTLDFGTVAIAGDLATREITLSNPAPANEALVYSLALTSGAPDYEAMGVTNIVIPVDGSVTIPVTFAPTLGGTRTGSIVITGNDPANPSITALLTGVGEGALFSLSPAALDFGDTVLVGTFAELPLTITNTGNQAGQITSITSGSSVFTVTPVGGALPRTIEPSETLEVTVRFTPADGSIVMSSLVIMTTGTPALFEVPVTGDGLYKAVTIAAENEGDLMIDLGDRRVGVAYTQVVTVTNTGEVPQTLELPTSSETACVVTPTSPATLPATLEPQDTATFEIVVTPTAVGLGTCTVTVTTDVPSTDTIVIDWDGVAPEVALTTPATPAINFGVVDVDAEGVIRTVVLTNTGTAPLVIGPCTVTGSVRFSVVTSCTNLAIEPGSTATLMVAFDPTVEAAESATLTITVDALSTSQVVIALSGVGADQRLDLSALSVAFPDADINQSEAPIAYIDIFNPVNPDTGIAETLHIASATIDSAVFTLANGGPFVVEAGQMVRLAITFRPPEPGVYDGTLTIISDASGLPMAEIALHGRGVIKPAGETGGCCQSSSRDSGVLALGVLALLLRRRRRRP